MKRTIAIVAGGDSSELVVSLRSAQGLYSFIDKERYNLYIVEMEGHRWEVVLPDGSKTPIDRNDFSFMENGEKKHFDFAYITIHGTPGENGILQGYFDLLGIPYSSCNVLVSAMTFNKFTCNQYLKGFGIRVAESLILRKGFEITDEEVINKIGLPCFIKPNAIFPVLTVNHRVKCQTHGKSPLYCFCRTRNPRLHIRRKMFICRNDRLRRHGKCKYYPLCDCLLFKIMHIGAFCPHFNCKIFMFRRKPHPLCRITDDRFDRKQIRIIRHTQVNAVLF